MHGPPRHYWRGREGVGDNERGQDHNATTVRYISLVTTTEGNHPLLGIPYNVRDQSKGDVAGKTKETLEGIILLLRNGFRTPARILRFNFTVLIHRD